MNPILLTVLKSLTSITVIFVLTMILSRKQFSQLTFFDYSMGIAIGAIAGLIAVSDLISYSKGMTALAVFSLIPVVISYVNQQSERGREWLRGRPMVLVENGRILEGNLRRAGYNVNDLLEQCRLKDAANILDVETAVLETSGKVSVQIKPQEQPLPPKDVNLQTAKKGLCTNLIIDGTVLWDHLQSLGKDSDWLYTQLRNRRVGDLDEVLLAYVDNTDKLNVYRKNNGRPVSPLM